jgi:uncharacterized membrane protein
MSEGPKPSTPVDLGAGRLEAFSDAVFAVIITILAFELRPPEGSSLVALKDALPALLIYVLSFLFIAIYWNNHHHLLRATTRISGGVMWANMFLLFCLSLIPVVTEWIHNSSTDGDQIDHFYADRIPVASFGLVALAAGFAYRLLVGSIIRANGRDSMVGVAISSDVKGWLSLAMYLVGVVFAFASWVRPAYVLYAAVAVMWLIPDRRFTRASNV